MTSREDIMEADHKQTTTVQLVVAWGFVGIPLLWGVSQTLLNALQLFK
jgi:hypothetical protein